jgi:hypothetical protein
MTLQELLQYLFPYFHGMRKLKNYISLELIFPKNWEFPNDIISKAQVEQNDKFNGDGYFLVFVSQPNSEFDNMIEVIAELINHNLEREEKERLLRAKVNELKEIFKHTSLTELKSLKINLETPEEDDLEDLLYDEQESTID